ncbi:TetR/AcrR family transcriptional regulator [Bradyrhizobium sp. WSM2254]|uniref:TetR/AcrR family transcriptional regulator n=1 Tax=Bradyrhizobium sp. WSM2254 TaxID=1188263 RepID=UPI000480F1B6|nr:TetR/AcrR family transcriptional regulator [Bradyrhizobium sp. WSM2254]
MSKADQTRERILSEALHQGTIHGFSVVSLADVAEAIGLSKSAVFKHFGAKDALQMAVLEKLADDFTRMVWDPSERLRPGRQRLDLIFQLWLTWVDGSAGGGGCGLIQAQIEFDDQPGELRAYLKKQQLRWNRVLVREFGALASLSREQAQQAAFEFRSLVLGYHQSRRLLNDDASPKLAHRAYQALIARSVGAGPRRAR